MWVESFLKGILSEEQARKLKAAKVWMLKMCGCDLDYLYNEDFVGRTDLRDKEWTHDFCEVILGIFNPRSIIDFGCGTADILLPFEKKGLVVKGIDGSSVCISNAMIRKENLELFDLRREYCPEIEYDLCFCLEVAEHIEEKFSRVLIENLTKVSRTVVFTAAVPGQTGISHINLKSPEWWVGKFQCYGFNLNEDLTGVLKKRMEGLAGIQHYYIDNLMVLQKT